MRRSITLLCRRSNSIAKVLCFLPSALDATHRSTHAALRLVHRLRHLLCKGDDVDDVDDALSPHLNSLWTTDDDARTAAAFREWTAGVASKTARRAVITRCAQLARQNPRQPVPAMECALQRLCALRDQQQFFLDGDPILAGVALPAYWTRSHCSQCCRATSWRSRRWTRS